MSKHTPGPWTVEEYGDDETPALVIHRGETENRICFMATPGSHGDPAIIEADAHLIAAAPDLLEALQDIADGADAKDFVRSRALAAIAKATSRSSR
jgi:hypothetical protein